MSIDKNRRKNTSYDKKMQSSYPDNCRYAVVHRMIKHFKRSQSFTSPLKS